jgi:hypothetical protein
MIAQKSRPMELLDVIFLSSKTPQAHQEHLYFMLEKSPSDRSCFEPASIISHGFFSFLIGSIDL